MFFRCSSKQNTKPQLTCLNKEKNPFSGNTIKAFQYVFFPLVFLMFCENPHDTYCMKLNFSTFWQKGRNVYSANSLRIVYKYCIRFDIFIPLIQSRHHQQQQKNHHISQKVLKLCDMDCKLNAIYLIHNNCQSLFFSQFSNLWNFLQ